MNSVFIGVWGGLTLALIFGGLGLTIALSYLFLIAWIDTDVYHNTCDYEQCPLKYDFVEYSSYVLSSFICLIIGLAITRLLVRLKVIEP